MWPAPARRTPSPARRRGRSPSLLLHEKGEFPVRFRVRDELVAGLARESLEILHRAGIGGEHLQHLPRLHVGQGFLGAQNRQRAIQAARVEFLVEVHKVLCRMPNAAPDAAPSWLVTVAQLPVEDPASRMRVLRTLESLGAAVM